MRQPFVPRSSQPISFFPVIVQSKWAHCKFEVSLILIVPSRHMLWQSVEGALFGNWMSFILVCNSHEIFEKSVLKKNVQCSRFRGVYSKDVHLYG
jgi:hypothetical protein